VLINSQKRGQVQTDDAKNQKVKVAINFIDHATLPSRQRADFFMVTFTNRSVN
jgi:hypothetical protein